MLITVQRSENTWSRTKKSPQSKPIKYTLCTYAMRRFSTDTHPNQIDVAVNAPEPGTIREFLANEEDTVTVGQDLLRLELGGPPKGGEKQQGGQQPKAPAPDEQSTSSDPEPQKDENRSEQESPAPPPPPERKPEPPKEESKPVTPPKEPPRQKEPPTKPQELKPEPKSKDTAPWGNREERRVSFPSIRRAQDLPTIRKVKMNRMRLRISERLKQSQNTAASLTTFNEVDMSNLMQFRRLYKDEVLKKTGVKLGYMSAFSRACILAMRDIPAVNASIEGPGGGDTIVYRDYVDISVAVATEKGLVTPVVRNTEALDLLGIERAIAELGKKV